MRWAVMLAILAGACGTASRTLPPASPAHICTFPRWFELRPVVITQPPATGTPTSLVFVFHGLNGTPQSIRGYSGLDLLASHDGALVVYPSALHGEWNQAPNVIGAAPDDVAYLDRLTAALQNAGCVEPQRVFAAGLSNGAGMAYRLACASTLNVVAIATVSGDYLGSDDCTLPRPVAAYAMHGKLDTTVPIGGVTYGTSVHPPVEQWAQGWAAQDGCRTRTGLHWTGCRGGVEVQLVEVANGKHEWFRSPDATTNAESFFLRFGL